MIQNPHIIILSLGFAIALCIGVYWYGRYWYESQMAKIKEIDNDRKEED